MLVSRQVVLARRCHVPIFCEEFCKLMPRTKFLSSVAGLFLMFCNLIQRFDFFVNTYYLRGAFIVHNHGLLKIS